MNKWIWIVVAVVVLIGGFLIFSGDDGSSNDTGGGDSTAPVTDTSNPPQPAEQTLDNAPDTEFSNLDTSDQVFNEIDSALNSLE